MGIRLQRRGPCENCFSMAPLRVAWCRIGTICNSGVTFAVLVLLIAVAGAAEPCAQASAQVIIISGVPSRTTSYYESSTSHRALYQQGASAGSKAEQGIVILDFGRPASDGFTDGTVGFGGRFISLASIEMAVRSFIKGYFRYAPAGMVLDVAIGTNNSCGAGQPCGSVTSCGCPDEPADFASWGNRFALTVLQARDWAFSYRAARGFSDQVRVIAADDAEPAYDPEYHNTYAVLKGYAQTVGASQPAMVDYGSADANYWTEAQLLQVAYGFAPDVPMPQIYYPGQVAQWAGLVHWAKVAKRKTVTIYGVLCGRKRGMVGPAHAYEDLLRAVAGTTDQASIQWLSVMPALGRRPRL